MVTGEVKRRASVERFAIRDRRAGRALHRWQDIWEGNPRIARPGEAFDAWLDNPPRSYIVAKGVQRWQWREYVPEPGEIFLTELDRRFCRHAVGKVVLQPAIKTGASPNKAWGLERWQALVDETPSIPWLQIGEESSPRLRNIDFLQTRNFREACAALQASRGAVLQEGGLHHAAAALGVRAVVIFGGFISPRVTGYRMHRNIFRDSHEHPLGCGMRAPCLHCAQAMADIGRQDIINELEALLT